MLLIDGKISRANKDQWGSHIWSNHNEVFKVLERKSETDSTGSETKSKQQPLLPLTSGSLRKLAVFVAT